MSDPFYDFDPNNRSDPKAPVYGIWGDYGTSMKTYSSRGHALNACATGRSSYRWRLFELRNGHWHEIAVKDTEAKNDKCDDCGGPVEATWDLRWGGWQRMGYAWCWERVNGPRSKINTPLKLWFLCRGCKNRRGY